jgi:hypothetical protein
MGFHLFELGARAMLDGQVKQQMAMHNVSVRFALSAPGPSNRDTTAKKDLTQALANFRKARAVVVIEGDRSRPVDGGMSDQRKTD